jgi:hypothetical protein
MHLEDPNVQGLLKGLEIKWFLGDQAEEDPEHIEEIFDLLLGRLGRWDPAEVRQSCSRSKSGGRVGRGRTGIQQPGNRSRRRTPYRLKV